MIRLTGGFNKIVTVGCEIKLESIWEKNGIMVAHKTINYTGYVASHATFSLRLVVKLMKNSCEIILYRL